jgi:hypothetical protein
MAGVIALALTALVLGLVACAFVYLVRRRRDPWRLLRDVGPVSGDWLADYRRTGPSTAS